MSFSFRNIFSPDEGDVEGAPTGFAPPAGAAGGELSRGGLDTGPAAPAVAGQDFLVSELIAYIPPAISAQSGIPMSRELRIPLPADGSRDVKLSTIYQICPELFASEITPLNDSTVTLPPKLGAMMGSGAAESASKPAATAATGFSPAASTAPPGFGANPAGPPADAANPFWSPAPTAESKKSPPALPSDMKDETPRPRQDEASAWPKESAGGLNPFAAQAPAAQIPAKGNAFAAPAATATEAKIPAGFDAPPAAPATGESAFPGGIPGGFSGFEPQPSSAIFGGSGSPAKNEADDKGGKAFTGNPFESEQGFNTLFSKQAEVDMDIPFPTGPAPGPAGKASEQVDEPQGVWGAMFHGGGGADTGEAVADDESFSPPTFESIGNLLKQGTGSAAAPAPTPASATAPAGFQSSPAPEPMTPTNAIPAGFAAFEAAPEKKEPAPAPAPELKEPAPAPKEEFPAATGFASFNAPTQGFAGFGADIVPTPSPIDSFASGAGFEAPAPEPAPAPAAVAEAAPAPAVAAPAPAREVAETAPTSRPSAPAAGEASFDMRDLELRAIFSTSETFTLSMVARRVVGLPGIVSCSLSTPGKLVQASKSEEGRIGNEAREMVATLRSLAKLTGLPEARTFTLHTDRGIVSLFLEGECCVMVHHEAAAFEPGVREKLILVARSLINLEE